MEISTASTNIKRIKMAAFNSREEVSQNLINTRVYPLNASGTKRIIAGLTPLENGEFSCVVKIVNNTFFGITFTKQAWEEFKLLFEKINNYFLYDNKDTPTPEKVLFEGFCLVYCTSFGTKTIILDKETPQHSITDSTEFQPLSKRKKKMYTPAIVMQKTTFEGIMGMSKCIDKCIQINEKLLSSVITCKNSIISEIYKKFNENTMLPRKDYFIKQYISSKDEEIKQKILSSFSIDFIEYYFDVIFYELLTLHTNEIVQKIVSSF